MSREIYNCGHTNRIIPGTIEVKTITRDGYHSTDIMQVCDNCLIWYRKNNLIIDNDEQRKRWLGIDRQSTQTVETEPNG
jgi:hypothetical protein